MTTSSLSSASLEAEVAGMDPDEAAELLSGFGVTDPGLDRVISACYRALDLITFLTTGEDETRAWEVRRGASAPEAAGVIHTDLQRGFIRAEVMSYEDLVGAGSWDAGKAKGLLRVEGKTYVVAEGDVLNIRSRYERNDSNSEQLAPAVGEPRGHQPRSTRSPVPVLGLGACLYELGHGIHEISQRHDPYRISHLRNQQVAKTAFGHGSDCSHDVPRRRSANYILGHHVFDRRGIDITFGGDRMQDARVR